MHRLITKLMFLLLLVSNVNHAQGRAMVGITGTVSPAFQIEPIATYSQEEGFVITEQQGAARVRVFIQDKRFPATETHEVTLIVALRTNAPTYRLLATPSNPDEPIEINLVAVAPSGNGARVAPTALAGFRGAKGLLVSSADLPIATGTRISMGGRFPAPDNAILVEIRIMLAAKSQSSLTLRLAQ